METRTVLIKASGSVLIVDGVGSIVYSQDQRPLSNIGRVIRTGIGIALLIYG